MAKFYPDHYQKLKVPPTSGELLLLKKLECLSDDHEVYFNPFLNHYRPDIVIVRKWFWVTIIEVKDWNLDLYDIHDAFTWTLKTGSGSSVRKKSPLDQVLAYKRSLLDVYLAQRVHKSVIATGVFFSQWGLNDIERVNKETKEAFERLNDSEKRRSQSIGTVSLYHRDENVDRFRIQSCNKKFTNEIYDEFTRYLRPNDFIKSQTCRFEFSDKQKELIVSSGQSMKIRGPAWCGKTSVLACRAKNANVRHWMWVLILTFNITLKAYIFQCIANFKGNLDAIAVTNYHTFIKPHLPSRNLSDYDEFHDLEIPEENRFDSIFIDEIQDYQWNWIRSVRENFLKQDGEFVVFSDEKQNIYDRALGQDKRVRTWIPGNWNSLDNLSFRLWNRLWDLALAFQQSFLNWKYHVDSPQIVRYMSNSRLDIDERSSISAWEVKWTEEVFNIYLETISIFWSHPDDVSIISTDTESLRKLEHYFERKGIQTESAFERYELIQEMRKNGFSADEINRYDRIAKSRFRPHSWKIKFSTVHSFKGWWCETTYLIIWKWFWSKPGDDELIYTWITRAKKNLVILSIGENRYLDFFKDQSD